MLLKSWISLKKPNMCRITADLTVDCKPNLQLCDSGLTSVVRTALSCLWLQWVTYIRLIIRLCGHDRCFLEMFLVWKFNVFVILFHPPFSSLNSLSAKILHLRSYLSCACSCSIFMRRLMVSVLMPGLETCSSSNSMCSCWEKKKEITWTISTWGEVNNSCVCFFVCLSLYVHFKKTLSPHCWEKERSWTLQPTCTYPPLDRSQTPVHHRRFLSSWWVAVLESLLLLSWVAYGWKKV